MRFFVRWVAAVCAAVLVIGIISFEPASAATYPQAFFGTGTRALILGDSITYISASDYRTSTPLGTAHALAIDGVPGRRLEDAQPDANAYAPANVKILVIDLGTNDAIPLSVDGRTATPPGTFALQLNKMVKTFPGACVVLVTMNDHTGTPTDGSRQGGDQYNVNAHALNQYIKGYPHVADWNFLLNDQPDPRAWLTTGSWVHPSTAGRVALVNLVNKRVASSC